MILHGQMLLDPDASPAPGWLRIVGERIDELRLTGEPPPSDAPLLGGPNRLITPGFIDAHTHPPQFSVVGCDGMSPFEWLDRVVFPAEVWWGRGAAREMTRRARRAMLREGTLGFAGNLTSHGQATRESIATLEGAPA